MRRMTFVTVLALAVLTTGKTIEDTQVETVTIDDAAFYARVRDSIVIVHNPRLLGTGKGSGIVVAKDIILTARHVVAENFFPPVVFFKGKSYFGKKVFKMENTDAAFILLMEPIEDARPIEWNMNPGKGEERAYAFGAWGELTTITYSAGTVVRDPQHIEFLGSELDWVLAGTPMLFFGFSGGALVDAEGRLMGVCFGASTDTGTKFVDARPLREIAFKPDLFK